MYSNVGGNTAARRIALDRLPPSRIEATIVSVAARSTRLCTVRAVINRPSILGRPLAGMIDSVRASVAAWTSRARAPDSGGRGRGVGEGRRGQYGESQGGA